MTHFKWDRSLRGDREAVLVAGRLASYGLSISSFWLLGELLLQA
jgi:hypothetical protein